MEERVTDLPFKLGDRLFEVQESGLHGGLAGYRMGDFTRIDPPRPAPLRQRVTIIVSSRARK
jgi:hypothetical protein